jgi:hypothetical protein
VRSAPSTVPRIASLFMTFPPESVSPLPT